MDLDQFFTFVNGIALIPWLLLAFFPYRKITRLLVRSGLFVLLFSLLYFALGLIYFAEGEGGFGSLAELQLLFSNPAILLMGWVHYLAFDLMVGMWMTANAEKHVIPHWQVAPCLFFTFMAGPVGWLMYMTLRTIHSRKVFEELTA